MPDDDEIETGEVETWVPFRPNTTYEISDHGNVRRNFEAASVRSMNGVSMVRKVGGTNLRMLERKPKKPSEKKVKGRVAMHPAGLYFQISMPVGIGIIYRTHEFRTADQVLYHFVPNPGNCRAFRYIDGDHKNIKACNLEWVPDDQIPVELREPSTASRTTRPETSQRAPLICVFPQEDARGKLDAALSTIYRKESK